MIDIQTIAEYLQTKINAIQVYKDNNAVKGIKFVIGTNYKYFDSTKDIRTIQGSLNLIDNQVEPFIYDVQAVTARYQLVFRVPEELTNTCYQYFNAFTDYINTHRGDGLSSTLFADTTITYAVPSTPNFGSSGGAYSDYSFIITLNSGNFGTKYNFNRKVKIDDVEIPCYVNEMSMIKSLGGGLFNNAIYSKNKPLSKAWAFTITAPRSVLPDSLVEEIYSTDNDKLQSTHLLTLQGALTASPTFTVTMASAVQKIVNTGVEIYTISFVVAKE